MMKTGAIKRAVKRAVAIAGSQQKLADLSGLSQPAISKMLRTGRMEGESALKIEGAVGGKVSRAALRPDLFGGADATR